jgi:hypothetical protein
MKIRRTTGNGPLRWRESEVDFRVGLSGVTAFGSRPIDSTHAIHVDTQGSHMDIRVAFQVGVRVSAHGAVTDGRHRVGKSPT